jgi:hypothetical protein
MLITDKIVWIVTGYTFKNISFYITASFVQIGMKCNITTIMKYHIWNGIQTRHDYVKHNNGNELYGDYCFVY